MKLMSMTVLAIMCLMAAAPLAQDAAQLELAKKVYVAKKCANCHSIAGKGNKKGPMDEVGSKLSEAEIREWLVNPVEMTKKTKADRKPVMKATNLTGADLDAMVAYMLSLKKK
jgi:mono/diheme cytochrome c family protein